MRIHTVTKTTSTRSVAARFGRHGMPPPACNDTGTTFFFTNEEEAEIRRTDDVSLWPWSLTLKLMCNVARVVECPPATFGDRQLRLFVSDLWAIGRCARRPLVSALGKASSLSIDRPAANCCRLDGRNRQITVFRRHNSRFRKRFS